jgi:alkylhydroperoxidase family enzyme
LSEAELTRALSQLEQRISASSLDPRLGELVSARVALVNGCKFCSAARNVHRLRPRAGQRGLVLTAWSDAPTAMPRERAILALVDAMLGLGEPGGSADAARIFSPAELADLLFAVAVRVWASIARGV